MAVALYGFQGALLRSNFESEYRVPNVKFNRTSIAESENIKVQIWTEIENPSRTSSALRNRSIKAENLIGKMPCSKIFIFSRDQAFVILSMALSSNHHPQFQIFFG